MYKKVQLFESSPDRGDILVKFTEQDKAESGNFTQKKPIVMLLHL